MSYLIECSCGKKLSVLNMKEGEEFLCPFCGVSHMAATDSSKVIPAAPEARPSVAPDAETKVMTDAPTTATLLTGSSEFAKQTGEYLGAYRVLGLVGKGAMGAVFKAHDESLDRVVAIKVLSKELSADADTVERFRREARSAAALSHPNIVHVYAIGKDGDRDFFVMEYVEGKSLAQVVQQNTRLNPGQAVEYVLQAAHGLDAAAKKGIVHRDIKPSNILLGDDAVVRIVDFGLSKVVKADASITGIGIVVGTPLYMSPEQGKGRKLDHRSDIYSLGATLYHLLSGKPPFDGTTPLEVLLKHATEPLTIPPELECDLPAEIVRITRKMMAKDRDKRYATYAQLIADLEAVRPRPLVFAGAWVRAFALAIDVFLCFSVALLLSFSVTFAFTTLAKRHGMPYRVMFGFGLLPVVFFIVFVLSYVLWHSLKGQTPGKMAMRIEVITTNGRRPGRKALLLRYFASFPFIGLSALLGALALAGIIDMGAIVVLATILMVLTLMALVLPGYAALDPRKRGVHDVAAGTYVVYKV